MFNVIGNGDGIVGIILRNDNSTVSVFGNSEVVRLAGGYVIFIMLINDALADARCVNQIDAIVNGNSTYC